MALFYTGDTEEGIALSRSGDLWVNDTGTSVSNEGIAFDFGEFANALAVLGSISSSASDGIVSDEASEAALIFVDEAASVSGYEDGMNLASELTAVINAGSVEATSFFGLYLGGATNIAVNLGSISGMSEGVATGGDLAILANIGSITSANEAGVHLGSFESFLLNAGTIGGAGGVSIGDVNLAGIANFGTITTEGDVAIDGTASTGMTILLNGGEVAGDVVLGSGDDIITNVGEATMGDVFAGEGNDAIVGTLNADMIDGEGGDDLIEGAGGNDDLFGDSGNDTVSGGNGDDIVHGGTGEDDLIGGRGSDIFVYEMGDGADTIYDLRNDVDMIDLTDWEFESTAEVMESATINLLQFEVQFDFGDGDVLTVKTSNPFDIQDDLMITPLAG